MVVEKKEDPVKSKSSEYPDHPRVAVGAVVFRNDKVLLVKRANHPGKGLWAIPGGRVRLGEKLQEAAQREILEETGLVIRARNPIFTFDMVEKDDAGRVRYHYLIVDLIADYVSGEICAGDDALDARWISPLEMSEYPTNISTRRLLMQKFGFGMDADGRWMGKKMVM